MPVLTVFAPVVSGAVPAVPVSCESICDPPADVPIFRVVWPADPLHTFLTSIEPVCRVLVNVQTTTSPFATLIELLAPGVNPFPFLVHTSPWS